MNSDQNSNPKQTISLIIPVFNEEETIPFLFDRCISSINKITDNFEIICVNDGSFDSSPMLLDEFHKRDHRWKVVHLSRNFGHQAAFLAGLENCTGEFIGMIDGDLQDPPELMIEFYKKLLEGYDVVYGVRKNRKEGFLKKFSYSTYYKLIDSISAVPIPLDSGDFCMMRRVVLNEILVSKEQSLFLRGTRSWVGFKQFGYSYDRDKREMGQTKYTLRKLFQLAYNGIYSFSTFPIKLLTQLGVIVVLGSLLYILYALYIKFHDPHTPQGFTTLAVAIFFFSGVQLIALGIIGEYVLRIYDESRKKPLYIIKNKKF